MKIFILACVIGVSGLLFVEAARFLILFSRAKEVVAQAEPYTQTPPNAELSVLVAGDSTDYGTGADKPEESVAGRLGMLLPQATVENISKNGLTTSGLHEMLDELPADAHYDLMVLQIGGNDILQFVSRNTIREEIQGVLGHAKAHATHVVLMSTGNVGVAPAFFFISEKLYTWRTKQVREILIGEAENAGVLYVDLFLPREDDPFAQDPQKYHAADGLHPSSEGYKVWFERLKSTLKEGTPLLDTK